MLEPEPLLLLFINSCFQAGMMGVFFVSSLGVHGVLTLRFSVGERGGFFSVGDWGGRFSVGEWGGWFLVVD